MGIRTRSITGALVLAGLVAGCAGGSRAGTAAAEAPGGPDAAASPATEAPTAMAIDRRVVALARRDLWPGFDPAAIPLAIHDGRLTWLFRHPAPPAEFRPVDGAHVMEGRHPAVTANTSAEIGGVETAILWEGALSGSVEAAAATAVHEAFHAYQRTHHPAWAGNEMDFFVYPVDDAELLSLRRLESEALRRALRADGVAAAACWAALAVALREERFVAMPVRAAAYERGNELNEGLARYVEWRALDEPPPAWQLADYPPEAVRLRTYATGAALGVLLDRFAPGWRRRLAEANDQPLDRMLAEALAGSSAAHGCAFAAEEREAAGRAAAADAGRVQEARRQTRRAFFDRAGWRLVVEAAAAPFNPRFDPLNLRVVGPAEVVHHRIILLDGPAGTVEVMGIPALTVGAGDHPLMGGVARLVVAGLADRPAVRDEEGRLVMTAEGLRLELTGAAVEAGEGVVTVRVGARDDAAPREPGIGEPGGQVQVGGVHRYLRVPRRRRGGRVDRGTAGPAASPQARTPLVSGTAT
jgi:hypothetical protein